MNRKKLRSLILASVCAVLVYFGLNLIDAYTSVREPTAAHPTEIYANHLRDDLRMTFVRAIDQAEKSVILTIYSLTDNRIIHALNKKADEGVEVVLVCDSKASKGAFSRLSKKIHLLKQRPKGLMHQKILVIDGIKSWIGSANMTTESLRLHGNLVIGAYDQKLAAFSTEKALHMDQMLPHLNFKLGAQNADFYFLPDAKQGLEKLTSMINTAKKTIKVAMFTWTHQDLAHAIVEARKRGIQVEVIMDHYSGNGASRQVVQILNEGKVPVAFSQGQSLLHYKMMIVDDQTLVNGSANWTQAAFSQNNDCFLVLYDLDSTQKKTLQALWQVIKDDSVAVAKDFYTHRE